MATVQSIRKDIFSAPPDEGILLFSFYCSKRQDDLNSPNAFVQKDIKTEKKKREKNIKLNASQTNILKQLGLIR